jgi:FkbH-like protein
MTLNQALEIINVRRDCDVAGNHFLVCGFEPLHLATLLRAHLLKRLPETQNIEVQTGVYGDFRGNLEAAARSTAVAASVVLEWSDIDPRLGLRSSGGWSNEAKSNILSSCRERYDHLALGVEKLGGRMPVAVAPPSLPLPPIGNTIRAQSSVFELEIQQQLATFLLRVASFPGVRVIQPPRSEASSLDARMELMAGFPYTVSFSDTLAKALVDVLHPPAPKKGLITDLDDTLWSGIVGEVGVEGVGWSQDRHAQMHGWYQQMLGHLAGCGVLLAVSSKNEQATVEAAFARKDFFLDPETLFPIHANWGPKSASVARILETWNIAADVVVFVDDNPMELAEVESAHPGITCIRFPRKDASAVWNLMGELRDLFGKPLVMEEDRLRAASIRQGREFQRMAENSATAPEAFLAEMNARITVDFEFAAADPRVLELVNKTNQFNLNGIRYTDGEWRKDLDQAGSFVVSVAYEDRFGPLGKIAVLRGRTRGATLEVGTWVMSCRAFARRIEHQCLRILLERFGIDTIHFDFQATKKNGPTQDFFELLLGHRPSEPFHLAKKMFDDKCPALYHAVEEIAGAKR